MGEKMRLGAQTVLSGARNELTAECFWRVECKSANDSWQG